MEDITEDETRKAAIAAAAQQAEVPAQTETAEEETPEAAAQPARKRAARKKAEQVKEEGIAAAAENEDRNLYWRGPTRLLKSAFSRVARAAGGGKSLPILRCIGLTWDAGGLTLHATNLDIHAQQKIANDEEADVSGRGGVAVEAAALGKLIDRAGKEIQSASGDLWPGSRCHQIAGMRLSSCCPWRTCRPCLGSTGEVCISRVGP